MKFLLVLALSPMVIFNAFAERFDPAPVNVGGGFFVVPQVLASTRYDDNIYNETSSTTSSSIFILKPSIKFGTDDGINRYGGFYELTSAAYSNNSKDNFTDHNLVLLAHTEYSDKHRTDLKLSFANVHEDRGSGLSEGNSSVFDEPLKYNKKSVNGYYQYGGLTSLMRVGGGGSFNNKTYQNFISSTKYDDVTSLKLFADADYQVANVTFLTFDIYTTNIQYDHLKSNENSRDNVDSSVLFGFKWSGLSKTTATMKAGYQYKTFDSDSRESFSGNTAELGLTWKPIDYSTFTARFSRAAKDSDTVGDYILELESSLEWKHYWTDDFDTNLQFVYIDEDYIGFTRSDKTKDLVLSLNYALTRWLQIQASYELTDKNSTETSISYDKNAVNLGIVVTL